MLLFSGTPMAVMSAQRTLGGTKCCAMHQWRISAHCECDHRPFFVMTSASLGIFLKGQAQSLSVLPVFLAVIGIAFYGLRGYVRSIAHAVEPALDQAYHTKMDDRKRRDPFAGLGFGIAVNVKWLVTYQRKILDFDKGVFIYLLSAALIFDQLTIMLWMFAASQLFWGTFNAWQRGANIDTNQKLAIQK
jgi:hypothetical protein